MHERTTDAAETAVPLPERQGRSYTPEASEQGRAMTSAEAGRFAGRPGVAREPLGRAERLQLAVLAGVFALVAAMLSAGAVALNNLGGQILGLQEQMGGIRAEIGDVRAEIGDVRAEIGGLRAEMHEEIGGLRAEMHEEIGGLRAEMREEIGGLRAEMREGIGNLSERMTRIETLIETHLVPASNARDPAGP